MYYWAGVDGGGTKTRGVITDDSCRVLGQGLAGPSNPLRVGVAKSVQQVLQALTHASEEAGLNLTQIAAFGIGLGGVRHASHHQATSEALQQALSSQRVALVPDAEIALLGATGGEPGVVIIAGTGSVACGMNAHGEIAYSGGWGPAFGDEGSGYDIARRALMAAVADYDGRGKPTKLRQAICEYFQVPDPMELLNIIYTHEHPADSPQIAPLAQLVVKAAQESDEIADEILHEAGTELGRAVNAVIYRLNMQSSAFRVAYVGSVFEAGDYILRPLWDVVSVAAPHAIMTAPLFPPSIGAIMLAKRRFAPL